MWYTKFRVIISRVPRPENNATTVLIKSISIPTMVWKIPTETFGWFGLGSPFNCISVGIYDNDIYVLNFSYTVYHIHCNLF